MDPALASPPTAAGTRERNLRFYDALWTDARLVEPHRFNTWPLVQPLAAAARDRLEIGPGLRPRLPIEGTCFVDISVPALTALGTRGGHAVVADATRLPFASQRYDLVCALDVIEHVDDSDAALAELARVCRPGGTILFSTPLHPARWTPFDDFVGHKRRYEPAALAARLAQCGLEVAHSVGFGMRPRSSRLVEIGLWWLTRHRELAMSTYNRTLMPLGLLLQKPLRLTEGLVGMDDLDDVLLVCRRQGAAGG